MPSVNSKSQFVLFLECLMSCWRAAGPPNAAAQRWMLVSAGVHSPRVNNKHRLFIFLPPRRVHNNQQPPQSDFEASAEGAKCITADSRCVETGSIWLRLPITSV